MTKKISWTLVAVAMATTCVAGCASRKAMQPQAASVTTAAPQVLVGAGAGGAPAGDVITVNTSDEMRTSGEMVVLSRALLTQSARFRSEIYARGGAVVSEDIKFSQAANASELGAFAAPARKNYARFTVTLPASGAAGLLQWLVQHHVIIHQAIAASQLAATARPEGEGAAEASPPLHNVSFVVTFVEEARRDAFDEASVQPSLRAVGLVTNALDRPADRELRTGVGLGLRFGNFALETTGILATGARSAGVIATMGGVIYARSMGDGTRAALNPYIQLKTGYAYLEGSAFVVGAEVGMEFIKHKGVALAASVTPLGLIGKDSTIAVQGAAELRVAF